MIGYRKKFIFVHVPKVAGRSFKKALSSHALRYSYLERPMHALVSRAKGYRIRTQENGLYHGHSTVKQYMKYLGREKYSQYNSFGLVRNPYDWHVSLYFYMRENPQHPQFSLISKMSFSEYVDWRCDAEPIWQKNYLCDNAGNISVTHLGKIEEVEKTINYLNINLNIKIVLPRLNVSARTEYQRYYKPKDRKNIYRKFSSDFELFNYDSEI